MSTPPIALRNDALADWLAKVDVRSVYDLCLRLRRRISISTTRRIVLGESAVSAGFIAALLELLGPHGAHFEDIFQFPYQEIGRAA